MEFQRLQKDIGPSALTIAEFCWRQKISVPSYYQLKKRGLGPVEMRFGNVVRITPEAEADWRAARENPVGAEAEDNAARAANLKARGQHAAKVSISSPNHIANRRIAAREKVA
jgi:hypothetical protein